eukprot:1125750-Rhodomonas_salina.1
MASNSAGDERAGILTSCADCVVAVDGERTQHSTEFVGQLYKELRQGERSLWQSWRRVEVSVAPAHRNLVLLPSLERAGQLRFQVDPKPMVDMLRRLENASLDDTDLSGADTSCAEDTDDDDCSCSPEATASVFLYTSSETIESVQNDVLELFRGLRSDGDHPSRLSFCGLLLFLMVSTPQKTNFDLGNGPEQWEAWKAAYKEAAASGSVSESELLDKFEEACKRSGAKSKFEPRVPSLPEPCLKVHTRAIQAIDTLVRDLIVSSWGLELSAWDESVVANWFCSEASSEEFLNRANRFLTQAIDDVDDTCIRGIHILETLQMRSYGVFLQMDRFTVNLIWSLLEVEQHSFRAREGGNRPAGGFETAIASDRRVLSLGNRKLPSAGVQSIIVRGLRSMAAMGSDFLRAQWKLYHKQKECAHDPSAFLAPQCSNAQKVCERIGPGAVQSLHEYLQACLHRTGEYMDSASGEVMNVRSHCINLQVVEKNSFSAICEEGSEAVDDDLICSIRHSIMEDPVRLKGDGVVEQACYERAAIQKHMEESKASPISRRQFASWELIPDETKRRNIATHVQQRQKQLLEGERHVEGQEERQSLLHRKGYLQSKAAAPDSQSRMVSDEDVLRESAKGQVFCVIGPPASGKTTTLLRIATCAAENALRNPEARIPLFIRASELPALLATQTEDDDGDIVSLYIARAAHLSSHKAVLSSLYSAGFLFVMIDGLDEIEVHRSRIEKFLDTRSRYQRFLVSTRSANFVDSRIRGRLKDFSLLEMQPLDEPTARAMVALRISNEAEQEAFWADIKPVRDRSPELVYSPYLLCLVIATFQQHGRIPTRRWELYQLSVEGMIRRCLSVSSAAVDQQWVTLGVRFFECLAYVCHVLEKKRDFPLDEGCMELLQQRWSLHVQNEAESESRNLISQLKSRLIEERLCGVLSRVATETSEGNETFRFCHLTQQAFLASSHLVSCSTGLQEVFQTLSRVSLLELDAWTREVYMFAASSLKQHDFHNFCALLLEHEDGTFALCEL